MGREVSSRMWEFGCISGKTFTVTDDDIREAHEALFPASATLHTAAKAFIDADEDGAERYEELKAAVVAAEGKNADAG